MSNWQNRIVAHGTADPRDLITHPLNWRSHPRFQRDQLTGVLSAVGWVQNVIVNRRTNRLVDGHLRCELAIQNHEPQIPVTYVDLTEDEEARILLSLDPIGAMAEADLGALDRLRERVQRETDEALGDLQRAATQQQPDVPLWFQAAPVSDDPNDQPTTTTAATRGWRPPTDSQIRQQAEALVVTGRADRPVTCPECGAGFTLPRG